jgi:NAD(P)-dependent dehydrogenase (short-subunit alcohol dehydrogenase family)
MPSNVLIIGSNQGLGYHCAVSLVKGGHNVILACRNVDAANKAADTIAA